MKDLFGNEIKSNIKRKYYHYTQWEDYKNGMWRKVDIKQEKEYLKKAIWFTSKYKLYGHWMKKVILKWEISCNQNLTDIEQNRKAWLGHAACCLAFKCPEYIVRQAWAFLTDEQRLLANKEAENTIKEWENNYA